VRVVETKCIFSVVDMERTTRFYRDDIDAACEAVERGGGAIVSPPKARPDEGNIKLASIADPEGNEVSLSEAPR
jgi:predicted enzyme related to lactoylglutathione lyase